MSNRFEQDDDDKLFRAFDWQQWLSDGETILTAQVTCDDDDLVISNITIDGSKVKYKVSGGVAGRRYMISCKVTTSDGETIERSIYLTISKLQADQFLICSKLPLDIGKTPAIIII